MKKKLLLFLSTVFSIISGYAQDSLYYSMLWKPTFTYRRAGVIDEEVFGYRYKDGVFQDSVLLHRNLFDSLGQLIRMDVYHGSILRARHQYFYSGNRLDSMIQEGIWIKPKITHRYSYDTSGNLALLEIFHGAAKSRQERYTYYGNNQPFQTFQKLDRRPETLISQYKYRRSPHSTS